VPRKAFIRSSPVLVAAFLSCSALPIKCAAGAADDPITVHGVVLNRVTHAPVHRALVYTFDEKFATLTDDRGRFELKLPISQNQLGEDMHHFASGDTQAAQKLANTGLSFSFSARKPGFADGSGSFDAETTAEPVTIYLEPQGLIVGKVSASALTSVLRFHLLLFRREVRDGQERWEQAGTFSTWVNGEFRFRELSAGTYKLCSQEQLDRDLQPMAGNQELFGYPATFFPNAFDFSSAAVIRVAPGETVEANIAVTRKPYYNVKIPVANGAANRISVTVFPLAHPGPGFSLGYDASEQAIVGSMPDGTYTVSATAYGKPLAYGTTTLVVRGAAVDGPALNLLPTSSVAVHLSEFFKSARSAPEDQSDGNSLVHARRNNPQVILVPTEEFSSTRTLVAQSGAEPDSLEIPDVVPGQYALQVSPRSGYLFSAVYGGVDVLHEPLLISLGPGYPLELTLRDDGARIDGTMEDSANATDSRRYNNVPPFLRGGVPSFRPPRFVYFVPTIGSSGQFRATGTGPDSTFTVEQLPPGEYLALIFASQHPELRFGGAEIVSQFASYGQIFQAAPEQKLRLTLKVVPDEAEE
jgi:hypothetical protein